MIFLFGRQGLITKGLFGITTANVYGMHSLIVVQTISFFPIAFMTLTGILSAIDDSVEDAAYNMGASRGHIFPHRHTAAVNAGHYQFNAACVHSVAGGFCKPCCPRRQLFHIVLWRPTGLLRGCLI